MTGLTAQRQDDAAAFGREDLSRTDLTYLWVDGIHLKVRLKETLAVNRPGNAGGSKPWK